MTIQTSPASSLKARQTATADAIRSLLDAANLRHLADHIAGGDMTPMASHVIMSLFLMLPDSVDMANWADPRTLGRFVAAEALDALLYGGEQDGPRWDVPEKKGFDYVSPHRATYLVDVRTSVRVIDRVEVRPLQWRDDVNVVEVVSTGDIVLLKESDVISRTVEKRSWGNDFGVCDWMPSDVLPEMDLAARALRDWTDDAVAIDPQVALLSDLESAFVEAHGLNPDFDAIVARLERARLNITSLRRSGARAPTEAA